MTSSKRRQCIGSPPVANAQVGHSSPKTSRKYEDVEDNSEKNHLNIKANRGVKLRLFKKRYSKKRAHREKRRRLVLREKYDSVEFVYDNVIRRPEELAEEHVEEPSTFGGRRHTEEKIIHLPSYEESETASSGEMQEIENIEEGTDVGSSTSKQENFIIEEVVMNEPQEQSSFSGGLSIFGMQHMFAEIHEIGDHSENREDFRSRPVKHRDPGTHMSTGRGGVWHTLQRSVVRRRERASTSKDECALLTQNANGGP
ncbi:hypothetical protein WN55_07971 [Dufourea novaeangliae]|uniref:Uncharacterized protein n=1 Tax=Dufourea novaeangliae TaxID=178035 RepID=A0A154PT51_DUFNO|nr:hypothetical protein WN55_07971 [Dufourea novaeangliae]